MSRPYEILYTISYYPDSSAPNGMREPTINTFDQIEVDLAILNAHFQTICTDFEQDGEEFMIVEDQRPEWYGDRFARRKPYVNRSYSL